MRELVSKIQTQRKEAGFEVMDRIRLSYMGPDTIEEWDSLAHISLIVSIEKHFLVKFSMEQVNELKSFGKIAAALEKMLS